MTSAMLVLEPIFALKRTPKGDPLKAQRCLEWWPGAKPRRPPTAHGGNGEHNRQAPSASTSKARNATVIAGAT
jgi:hypothetical protein